MKAIRVTAFGEPDVLELMDIDRPQPGDGEALIRIAAAGVNYSDVTQRRGRPGSTVPYIAGGEASGIVDALGPNAAGVRVGDRVAYAMVQGSYAEYATVPVKQLLPVPDDLDLVEAAAVPLQAITAHYLLHGFRTVGPGTTVLVHAAAGGVGLLLTQYATHLGAHVIGTTSSDEKADIARRAGARDVINYETANFADEVKRLTGGVGVDLVLDAVGKTTFPGDLDAAHIRGQIVIYGGASGQPDPIVPNALMPKALTLSGGSYGNFVADRAELLQRANDVFAGIREGWLKLSIYRIPSLADAAEAHRLLESRKTSGKLLLRAAAT